MSFRFSYSSDENSSEDYNTGPTLYDNNECEQEEYDNTINIIVETSNLLQNYCHENSILMFNHPQTTSIMIDWLTTK